MSMDFNATVARLLNAHDLGQLTGLPSADATALLGADHGITMTEAYALALELRSKRIARGERAVGYKIGFTNRNIWATYGVHAPVWSTVWARGLHYASHSILSTLSLENPIKTSASKIEPEVVFSFKQPPHPGMTDAQLADCLEWAAFGFEIVHCHYENWKFTAPDAVIDFGLHAHLFVGEPVPLNGSLAAARSLSQLNVSLLCDGEVKDYGVGSNVLDGPFEALKHFVNEITQMEGAPALKAGDVVTTGTLTGAWPLHAAQRWSVQIENAPLRGFELQITA